MSMTTVTLAECHDTCLDVTYEGHTANVNPIGYPYQQPTLWRVDCDHCGTCVSAGFTTKAEARDEAMVHVRMTPTEFWEIRDAENNTPV